MASLVNIEFQESWSSGERGERRREGEREGETVSQKLQINEYL